MKEEILCDVAAETWCALSRIAHYIVEDTKAALQFYDSA